MSERLSARAERLKLARVLGVDETELAFLEPVPSADLRAFREQATNRLFDSSSKLLGNVGAAARLLPSGVVATIAQRAFGPLLCARAAGAVDTGKAIDVSKRLPPDFLADVTILIDPRRVAPIIAEVPEELVVPVAEELGAREEYVTMGRFLAFVPDHAIAAAIGVLSDEALLRTAFVLEHQDRLDHAVGFLPPERLPGVINSASAMALWPEVLDLLDHLSDTRRGPLADQVAEQDEAIVAELVAAVSEADLWDSLLPTVRVMNPAARERLAGMATFHDPALMTTIIGAAAAQGLWVDLVPLIDALPASVRARLPVIAAGLDPELLANIVADAAAAPHTLPTLLTLADALDGAARATIIAAIEAIDGEVADQMVTSLTDPALLKILLDGVPPDIFAAVERAAVRHGLEDVLAERIRATQE